MANWNDLKGINPNSIAPADDYLDWQEEQFIKELDVMGVVGDDEPWSDFDIEKALAERKEN